MSEPKFNEKEVMSLYEDYYEKGMTYRTLAEKYGCSDITVRRWLNRDRPYQKYSEKIDARKKRALLRSNIAVIKLIEAAPEMVDQLIRIASQSVADTPIKYQYAIQNAAVEILNRAGIKAKDEEDHEVHVILESNIELGTPDGTE